MSNPEDLYVRNLKKKYPQMPNPCLKCKLFLESKEYKSGYTRYECNGFEDKKVLIVLPHPKEKINVKKYINDYFKDYIVYTTYSIKCDPCSTEPKLLHTRNCSNFLREEIEKIQPDLVITLGTISKDAWKEVSNGD